MWCLTRMHLPVLSHVHTRKFMLKCRRNRDLEGVGRSRYVMVVNVGVMMMVWRGHLWL